MTPLNPLVCPVGGAAGEAPQAPEGQGLEASHLHSLCHNSSLVKCVVLVKAGNGWIQVLILAFNICLINTFRLMTEKC